MPISLLSVLLASAVDLDLQRCPSVQASLVRSVFRASMDAKTADLDARLRIRCVGPEVQIAVDGRRPGVVRSATLLSPSGSGRSRELALLLAETAAAAAEAMQESSVREESAPEQARADPDATASRVRRTIGLTVGPSLWFDSDGATSFGLDGGASWTPRGLSFRGELSAHWSRSSDPLGEARSRRLSAGIWLGPELQQDRLRAGIGAGLRVGWLRVAGEALDARTAGARTEDFSFWGPSLAAHVAWSPWPRWALLLRPELGWAARGARATAQTRTVVDLRNVWGRLQLGLEWRP